MGRRNNSHILTGLDHGRVYSVRLVVTDIINTQDQTFSKFQQKATQTSIPGPPQNVTVQTLGSTWFNVTWHPPLYNQRNGQIIKYTVAVDISNSDGFYIEKETTDTSLTFTDGLSDSEHTFCIFAHTSEGKHANGECRTRYSFVETTIGQVDNDVNVQPEATLQNVKVLLSPSDTKVANYECWLMCVPRNATPIIELSPDPCKLRKIERLTANQYTFKGLLPFVEYEFRAMYVRFSSDLQSKYGVVLGADTITHILASFVPATVATMPKTTRPAKPTVAVKAGSIIPESVTYNKITAKWELPREQDHNGIPREYQMECTRVEGSLYADQSLNRTTATTVKSPRLFPIGEFTRLESTCEPLEANVPYTVSVKLKNMDPAVFSDPSETIITTKPYTPEGSPKILTSSNETSNGQKHVLVKWTLPQDRLHLQNGAVRGFRVSWWRGLESYVENGQ